MWVTQSDISDNETSLCVYKHLKLCIHHISISNNNAWSELSLNSRDGLERVSVRAFVGMHPILNLSLDGSEVLQQNKRDGCVFPGPSAYFFLLHVALIPRYSDASQCQIKPSTHPSPNPQEKGGKRQKSQSVIGAAFVAPIDRYSKPRVYPAQDLWLTTQLTRATGVWLRIMKRRWEKRGVRKEENTGPVYLSYSRVFGVLRRASGSG